MLLEPSNDYTITRYREAFYDPVFKKGETIKGTISGIVDKAVTKPLVYSLTFSGKSWRGAPKITGVVTLVFFDTAGEDLNSEDTMSTVNKYIYRSDGIILLVDPLQLERVRDRLGAGVDMPDMQTETADIMNRVTRLIEQGRGVSPSEQISIPTAVAFSKFDAVRPLIDDQFQIVASPNHERGYDEADLQAVNSEMIALLEEWGGQELIHLLDTRFQRHSFFGLSALGCNPHGTAKIPRVISQRVADPFLWLLAQHQLIRPRQSR
jgi:hypothetical protein